MPHETMCKGGEAVRYTVAQAAKAVGKSKATLHRAIQAGRISAIRPEATSAFWIDAAELYRVFPPVSDSPHDSAESPHESTHDASRDGEMRAHLLAAETRIAEMQEAARLRDDTIADLRRRLDIATEQLGEALTQVRVLTDQRTPAAPTTAPARRSWWPWGWR